VGCLSWRSIGRGTVPALPKLTLLVIVPKSCTLTGVPLDQEAKNRLERKITQLEGTGGYVKGAKREARKSPLMFIRDRQSLFFTNIASKIQSQHLLHIGSYWTL
jgi:hypothetical protein